MFHRRREIGFEHETASFAVRDCVLLIASRVEVEMLI
jgi:hypothetical protein